MAALFSQDLTSAGGRPAIQPFRAALSLLADACPTAASPRAAPPASSQQHAAALCAPAPPPPAGQLQQLPPAAVQLQPDAAGALPLTAAAPGAPTDSFTADAAACAALLRLALPLQDLCWEKLHLGHWKDVHVAWRDAYALSTLLVAIGSLLPTVTAVAPHARALLADLGPAPAAGDRASSSAADDRPPAAAAPLPSRLQLPVPADPAAPACSEPTATAACSDAAAGLASAAALPPCGAGTGQLAPPPPPPPPTASSVSRLCPIEMLRQVDLAVMMAGPRFRSHLDALIATLEAHLRHAALPAAPTGAGRAAAAGAAAEGYALGRHADAVRSHFSSADGAAAAWRGGGAEGPPRDVAPPLAASTHRRRGAAFDEHLPAEMSAVPADPRGKTLSSAKPPAPPPPAKRRKLSLPPPRTVSIGATPDSLVLAACCLPPAAQPSPAVGNSAPGPHAAAAVSLAPASAQLLTFKRSGGGSAEDAADGSSSDRNDDYDDSGNGGEGSGGGRRLGVHGGGAGGTSSRWRGAGPRVPLPPGSLGAAGGGGADSHRVPVEHCPSLEHFLLAHMTPGLPLIITGAMTEWPALERWQDVAYLRQVAGLRTVPIEVGSNYLADAWGQQLMTMADFIDRHVAAPPPAPRVPFQGRSAGDGAAAAEAGGGAAGLEARAPMLEGAKDVPAGAAAALPPPPPPLGYLAQHPLFDQIPALAADTRTPDYCCLGDGELQGVNAWFGPAATVTPLHYDPPHHNLLAQVVGCKYVRLYSPQLSSVLYAHESDAMKSNSSQIDLDHPSAVGTAEVASAFPGFGAAPFQDCVLHAGQMLYIPPGWWHYVKSLSRSFSVSYWWC